MGKPRPGVVVSAVRVLGLVVPLTWLGVLFAPAVGASALVGAFAGSTLGTGLGSAWMVVWIRRSLREVEPILAGPEPGGA
jgi:hypothetical protein